MSWVAEYQIFFLGVIAGSACTIIGMAVVSYTVWHAFLSAIANPYRD